MRIFVKHLSNIVVNTLHIKKNLMKGILLKPHVWMGDMLIINKRDIVNT